MSSKDGFKGDGKITVQAGEPSTPTTTPTEEGVQAGLKGRFAYFMTPRFYIVLLIGQILSLCITSTNTFSGLLGAQGTSIPAFQTFFSYVLLNIVYTPYTIYKYGFKGWCRMIFKDWWRYIIMSFLDVEGNYFVVLAYRYTTILSAQLINFWAIVVVVIISYCFLRVRYTWAQILGILICCGGLGLLLVSDNENGSPVGGVLPTEVKGDLFMLLGATFYGFSNVLEEFLVSKRPMYEVVGQIGFWGMLINGTQAGIFDRSSFKTANWNRKVGGYMVGYTLAMFIFYTLVPILLRMASAAFFNISLLTANFWGVVIGIRVFGYTIHRLYPGAFVMIIVGLVIYFAFHGLLGESEKPWLGENQEEGVVGVGTAKRAIRGRDEETGAETERAGEGMEERGQKRVWGVVNLCGPRK